MCKIRMQLKQGGLKQAFKDSGHSVVKPVGNKWPVGVHVRLGCNCSRGGLEKAFHHHCRHFHHFLPPCREPLVSLHRRRPPFLPAGSDLPTYLLTYLHRTYLPSLNLPNCKLPSYLPFNLPISLSTYLPILQREPCITPPPPSTIPTSWVGPTYLPTYLPT